MQEVPVLRPALVSNAMLQNDGPVAGCCRRAVDIIGAQLKYQILKEK